MSSSLCRRRTVVPSEAEVQLFSLVTGLRDKGKACIRPRVRNANSNLRLVYLCVLLLCASQTSQTEVKRKVAENSEMELSENGSNTVGGRKLNAARNVIESKVQTSNEGGTTTESFSNTKTVAPSEARGTTTSVEENNTLLFKDAEMSRIAPSVSSPSGPGASSTDEASYQNPSRTSSTSENGKSSPSSSSTNSKSSTSKSGGGTTTSTREPVKPPAKSPRGSTLSKRKSADDDDDDDDGKSRGAKKGTAASSIVGLVLFASGIALCLCCRNRRKKKAEYGEIPSEQEAELDPEGSPPLEVSETD